MIELRSRRLIAVSGWLVLAAVAGAIAVDALWWALTPAAGFLAVGLLMRPAFAADGLARLGASALAGALLASLATSALGVLVVAQKGFEPVWVGRLTTVAGVAILVAALMLGTGIAVRGRRSAMLGVLVAGSLPLGFGIDSITRSVLPRGIFFADAGLLLGLLLLAIALIRLGSGVRQRTVSQGLVRRRRSSAGRRRRAIFGSAR